MSTVDPNNAKPRILVVEDEPSILDGVLYALEAAEEPMVDKANVFAVLLEE